MKSNWDTITPEKSENHINEWADYAELSCLVTKDIVAVDDVLDVMGDSRMIDPDDEASRNEDRYDSESYAIIIRDAYAIIRYREIKLGTGYPFHLNGDCLELKDGFDVNHSIYVFLLLASCTRQVSSFQAYTGRFEKLCGMLSRAVSFVGSENKLVGTSGVVQGGSVYEKVENIAGLINSNTTPSFQKSKRPHSASGGDGGVDLVSVRVFDDEWAYRPLILGQCTCSRDSWEEKQNSISHELWIRRICDLPRHIEMMWLPFSICGANGMPENPSNIRTCIMDRYRIMEVACGNKELVDRFEFADVIRRELAVDEG